MDWIKIHSYHHKLMMDTFEKVLIINLCALCVLYLNMQFGVYVILFALIYIISIISKSTCELMWYPSSHKNCWWEGKD